MPTVAVIVLIVVAALLLAMLIAGARKASHPHPQDLSPADDAIQPYRSHAEASRRSDGGGG